MECVLGFMLTRAPRSPEGEGLRAEERYNEVFNLVKGYTSTFYLRDVMLTRAPRSPEGEGLCAEERYFGVFNLVKGCTRHLLFAG